MALVNAKCIINNINEFGLNFNCHRQPNSQALFVQVLVVTKEQIQNAIHLPPCMHGYGVTRVAILILVGMFLVLSRLRRNQLSSYAVK